MNDTRQQVVDALIDHIDRAIKKGSVTNQQVAAVLDFLNERLKNFIEYNIEELAKVFLRKDRPDQTEFLLTLLGDAQFGRFIPGLTGEGGSIDKYGDAELNSLILRAFLEVPELRFNRVQIKLGDNWRAPGAGVIESVNTETQTVKLKLEEGEIGAVAVDDICMGIFHATGDESHMNATEDTDDSRGNRTFAGFYTVYFRITEVSGDNNELFKYQLRTPSDRWKFSFHPAQFMNFVAYGNFSNEERQTSVYETRTYTRMLWRQADWEIEARNIAMQYGDMGNMNIHGKNMTGYSMYLNHIYMAGTLSQINPDGTEARLARDRGKWEADTTYEYFDRVSHMGGLWLCVAEQGTNTEPSEKDPAWLIQVAPGTSITSKERWNSADLPYKANTILVFANKIWISNKETSEAPYPLVTTNNGDYILQTQDNEETYSYVIATYEQSEDWDLLLDANNLIQGKDGEGLEVRYSVDKTNWHSTFQTGDIWMQQRIGDGIWSDAMRIVGETGTDGRWTNYQFAVNTSLTVRPTSGWQDAPPTVLSGQYLWMRVGVVIPPAEEPVEWYYSRIGGEQGASVVHLGEWKTGLTVPYLGVVRMGAATWMCINANGTENPPLWVHTDKDGNRILQMQDDVTYRYILTGEKNTGEYKLVSEDGIGIKTLVTEYYRSSSSTSLTGGSWSTTRPSSASGWYIWTRTVTTYTDGNITRTDAVCITGDSGKDGNQGCIMRTPEWTLGKEFRNDENLASGTRFLDIAMVRDNSLTTGWKPYKCVKTHISSIANAPGNSEYWEEFGLNVNAIYSPLILGENSSIEFMQSNQLLVKDTIGNVTGGISGQGHYWMGGPSPFNAANVDRADGSGHRALGNIAWDANGNADIKGKITATSGVFYGYNLTPYKIYTGSGLDFPDVMDGMNIMLTYDRGNMAFTLPADNKYDGLEIEILYTSGTYYAQINSPGHLRLYWRGEYITHIILFGEFSSVRLKAFKKASGTLIWRIMNAADFNWMNGGPGSNITYAQSKVGNQ